MDPNTKLKVGDRLIVMSLAEAERLYDVSRDAYGVSEIIFPEEKPEYSLGRSFDFVREHEGRIVTIARVEENRSNHFHYFVDTDTDQEGWAWCPSMFSGYADEETVEPPDPMSMWYFLGITENRNPRKK